MLPAMKMAMREHVSGEADWRRLEAIRREIDETDDEIAALLSRRVKLALSARDVKKALKIQISDAKREREVLEKWRARAKSEIPFKKDECCSAADIYEEMFARIAAEIVRYTLQIEEEMDCLEDNVDERQD